MSQPKHLGYVEKKPYLASVVRERQHGMQKLKSFRDAHSKMIRARNNPLKLYISSHTEESVKE